MRKPGFWAAEFWVPGLLAALAVLGLLALAGPRLGLVLIVLACAVLLAVVLRMMRRDARRPTASRRLR